MSSNIKIKELDDQMVSWYLAYYDYDEWYDRKLLDQKKVDVFTKDFKKSSMYKALHEMYDELFSKKSSQSKCIKLCSSLLKVYFNRGKDYNIYKNINVSDLSFSENYNVVYVNTCYSSINLHELEYFIDEYLQSGLYSKNLNILLIRLLVGIENTAYSLSESSVIPKIIYHLKYYKMHKSPIRYSAIFVFLNMITSFISWFCKILLIIILLHFFANLSNEKFTLIQSIIFAIIFNKTNDIINLIISNKSKMQHSMTSLMASISGTRGKLISTSELKHRLNYASEKGAIYPTQIYHLIELEEKNR